MYRRTVILLARTLALCVCATAAARADGASNDTTTTVINADRMEFDYDAMVTYWHGNVVVSDPSGKLKADVAVVELETNKVGRQEGVGTASANRIPFKRVLATGNVKMTSGTREVVSDKAVWTSEDNRIILSGDKRRPIYREGASYYLTADRIVYDVKTQKFGLQPKAELVVNITPEQQARFIDKSTGTATDDKKKQK